MAQQNLTAEPPQGPTSWCFDCDEKEGEGECNRCTLVQSYLKYTFLKAKLSRRMEDGDRRGGKGRGGRKGSFFFPHCFLDVVMSKIVEFFSKKEVGEAGRQQLGKHGGGGGPGGGSSPKGGSNGRGSGSDGGGDHRKHNSLDKTEAYTGTSFFHTGTYDQWRRGEMLMLSLFLVALGGNLSVLVQSQIDLDNCVQEGCTTWMQVQIFLKAMVVVPLVVSSAGITIVAWMFLAIGGI